MFSNSLLEYMNHIYESTTKKWLQRDGRGEKIRDPTLDVIKALMVQAYRDGERYEKAKHGDGVQDKKTKGKITYSVALTL